SVLPRNLRHPLRRHERAHLDHRQARVEQRVAERDLVVDRDLRGLVLQAVPRPDLDHGHARWERHSSSTSVVPGCTMSPTFTTTVLIVPSRGARRAFSIFIASTTTTSSPFFTAWPGAALTAMTLPRSAEHTS